MKKILIALLFTTVADSLLAQEIAKPPRIGWYITPEVGAMFLDNHVGRVLGASFGLKLWKDRLKVGIVGYGRSGPLNPSTFDTKLASGQTYLGKTTLKLRSDWGVIGGMIAPTFKIKQVEIDVPISFGLGIGGFYLHGDDRKTPDGARVSVWEDKLFNGEDAAAGGMTEFGVRAFFPTKTKGVKWGAGLHYTLISGWKTYYDPKGDFYNNKLRASVFINFGSY